MISPLHAPDAGAQNRFVRSNAGILPTSFRRPS